MLKSYGDLFMNNMEETKQRQIAVIVNNALLNGGTNQLNSNLAHSCIYSDPLLFLKSKQDIITIFALVGRYFAPTQSIHSVSLCQNVVMIDVTTTFRWGLTFFTVPIPLRHVSSFTFDDKKKVAKIEVIWSFGDLCFHVPIFGPLYRNYVLPACGRAIATLGEKLVS